MILLPIALGVTFVAWVVVIATAGLKRGSPHGPAGRYVAYVAIAIAIVVVLASLLVTGRKLGGL